MSEHSAFSANKTLKNTSDHQDAVPAKQCQVDVQKFQISVTATIVQVVSASKFDILNHFKGHTQKWGAMTHFQKTKQNKKHAHTYICKKENKQKNGYPLEYFEKGENNLLLA